MSGSSSSLAKLTSISTLTLSLLLERQRLHTLSPSVASPHNSGKAQSLHLPQIRKNLTRLRAGILEAEGSTAGASEGGKEALRLLKGQYERMRGMLGPDVVGVESLEPEEREEETAPLISAPTPTLPATALGLLSRDKDAGYTPYSDNPDADSSDPPEDNGILLQTQRRMMDEQDHHLDNLSHSITRQHHISVQINDELDVHHGLLEVLDNDLDHTESRLGSARRRLDKVARGVGNNDVPSTMLSPRVRLMSASRFRFFIHYFVIHRHL
ncbi:hypothetical protein DXG01_005420 [Tephrocybe rancida]|nr:hypothetical protein DXG01_005420 [Tephrocybe rancida]